MIIHFRPPALFRHGLRGTSRLLSTSSNAYPFSKVAIILPKSPSQSTKSLQSGKGLMPYLYKMLPPPDKQEMLSTLFSKTHPKRIPVGSVLTVTLSHAPTIFSGVLMAIRRRGPDTSFLLRNVIQGVGVEMQFFVGSPHLKEIKVVHRAGAKTGKSMRRAKLYYLRDAPDKMTAISSGQRG
jgi:large subunit ribosomal protein L19